MFARYRPRNLQFLRVADCAGYRLKVYSIAPDGIDFDATRFEPAWAMAQAALPQPATNTQRPGVGFVILHQAATGDYLVLCWWDRENELPTRVFYRDDNTEWRPAEGSESFCVWDLEVLWHERQAYVSTVLSPSDAPIEEYLANVSSGDV